MRKSLHELPMFAWQYTFLHWRHSLSVDRMARQVADRLGRVDVLVTNAGISSSVPAEDLDVAEWRRVMDVNRLGPFLMCRAFCRMMLARGDGAIINVASIAGLLGVAE